MHTVGGPEAVKSLAWQENGIDYISVVHVYFEILTLFLQLDMEHLQCKLPCVSVGFNAPFIAMRRFTVD